jgi:peptidoglycan pentaglycine glycine transferase (the first glycine)
MIEPNWDLIIQSLPNAHLLQTNEWAEVKKDVGWRSHPLTWKDEQGNLVAAAMILTRGVRPLGIGPKLTVGYIPRGPILDWGNQKLRTQVLETIEEYTIKNKIIFLKIDPGRELSTESTLGNEFVGNLRSRGWRESPEQVQFKNTVQIDLTGSEDDWLKKMKQKTRYNLRLAQRSGVVIRVANLTELPNLYKLYTQTAARDGFIIREEQYYLKVWNLFISSGMAVPLVAEVEGEPIAGLILFYFSGRAWYLYGMSTTSHREKMPNYLLQWEAMRFAKSKDCKIYDLWGAPDIFDDSDSMFGVFRFKEGLGGEVIRTPGAWDFTQRPILYFIYQRVLPKILDITRWIRRGKILKEAK